MAQYLILKHIVQAVWTTYHTMIFWMALKYKINPYTHIGHGSYLGHIYHHCTTFYFQNLHFVMNHSQLNASRHKLRSSSGTRSRSVSFYEFPTTTLGPGYLSRVSSFLSRICFNFYYFCGEGKSGGCWKLPSLHHCTLPHINPFLQTCQWKWVNKIETSRS